MNSDEFVFFSFYRRKHRFSAQIFYLIEENERKNGEIVGHLQKRVDSIAQ